MKYLTMIISILILSHGALADDTVENLDIERYMGKWYEIASIPQSFSEDCFTNTTAEYELDEDGRVDVINSCEEESGKIDVANGKARINKDFNINSKLQVTFVRFFGAWIWSFSGDYWVIDLGKNYEYSVVGDPTQEFLWILSRTPSMTLSKVKEIRSLIEAKGYDSCKVLMSRSSLNSIKERTPLCELN